MILIDAVYINNSGGAILLQYLIDQLSIKNIEFKLLLDMRICNKLIIRDIIENVYVNPSEIERYKFYNKNRSEYSAVLCFGNVPPPIKIKSCVYTYFHNIFLLDSPRSLSSSNKLKLYFKLLYIYINKNHCNQWIVQTENMNKLLIDKLKLSNDSVIKYPFYNEEIFYKINADLKGGDDYAFIANYIPEKNHKLLIETWINLAECGYYPVLHLTLSKYPAFLQDLLDLAQIKGAHIINHGYCSLDEIVEIYKTCKAIVYPSDNESFGLGIIESIQQGCDVLGPNLPYIHSVCKPSIVFDLNLESMTSSIITYETHEVPKTICKLSNQINELINILTNNNFF